MGKETGFLEYKRDEDATIPVSDRIKNYNEFHVPLDAAARREQGARCMNCGVPMCQSAIKLKGMVTGCPLYNLIPEWNDEIYHDHIEHALSRLLKTSNFPEFTGRVCPSLCEKACICGMNGDSVTVHNNELYLIETAWQQGLMKPRIPAVRSGKKVAVARDHQVLLLLTSSITVDIMSLFSSARTGSADFSCMESLTRSFRRKSSSEE